MLDLVAMTFLGCLAGTISGLTPGIHINTLAVFTLAAYYKYLPDPLPVCAFVIGMSVMHSVSDFVPSIFLGAPDPSTALSVLPAHKMLFEGRGIEALALSVVGCLGGMLLLALTLPVLIGAVPAVYSAIRPKIFWMLAVTLAYVFSRSDKLGKSILIFLVSGAFGFLVLNSALLNQNFILFPTFTGLFGLSNLLLSFETSAGIPEQKSEYDIPKELGVKGSAAGFLGGLFAGIMPGLGGSQSAAVVQGLLGLTGAELFIVAVGTIGTIDMVLSILSIYLIGNPRSGSAVVIQQMISELDLPTMLIFVGLCLFAAGIASILTMKIGRCASALVTKIDYRKLVASVILFLVMMVFIYTGLLGLVIAATGTALGILIQTWGVNKSMAMGTLLVPTLLFFSGYLWVPLSLLV